MQCADRTEDGLRSSPVLRRHSWSREVVRISPPSPSTATPFAAGGRPLLASPGHHAAGLMPSPSLPVPSLDKVRPLQLFQVHALLTEAFPHP